LEAVQQTAAVILGGIAPVSAITVESRFSLLMAVALLIVKDFHAREPLEFCFIAYIFAAIESPREPHFPNRNQRYVLDFTRLPFLRRLICFL
jgi:hypothetical protein